jgi:hypothetical protein
MIEYKHKENSMNAKSTLKKLAYLKTQHAKAHSIVEALEGENAPEEAIIKQKKIKLAIKDEIAQIEMALKAEGVEYVG